MSPALETLLAGAYQLRQLQHNDPGGVAHLRDGFADDAALKIEAEIERARLDDVIRARESGGKHGDHVSLVLGRLLGQALPGVPNVA